MPMESEARRGAMYAAASGKGKLGIPRKVAKKYVHEDKGGKLPKKKRHKTMMEG